MEKGIKIKYRKGNPLVYDDAERERHEEFYFSAYDVNKEIGHLIVTKIIDPVDELEIELDNLDQKVEKLYEEIS